MKKILSLFLFIVFLMIGGYFGFKEGVPRILETNKGKILEFHLDRESQSDTASQTSQLPNPASVHCIEKNGKLEIREHEGGGQYGVCVFADGSECEEWAFFRGECVPVMNPIVDPIVDPIVAPVEETAKEATEKLIGGERDEHGCYLMAGYTWCEAKQKCLRTWEEPCE